MATIINNPDSSGGSGGGGVGIVVGALVLLVIFLLFFFYGFPSPRGGDTDSGGDGGTTVNIPDKIEVDMNDSSAQ